MSDPIRSEILQNLNFKGSMTYTELRSLTRFKSRADSGRFAFHMKSLIQESLVMLDSSEGRYYSVTDSGKMESGAST